MSKPAIEVIAQSDITDWQIKVFLAEYVTGQSLASMIASRTEMTDVEITKFNKLSQNLSDGTPLQILTGTASFMGTELKVRKGVFIPRPETEQLVDRTVKMLADSPKTILEIGTGTGAIAIALAKRYPDAAVYATDISADAVELARENARELEVRINFIQADLFQFNDLRKIAGKIDLLISNPPYIPSRVIQNLPVEVREYDPVAALDGGEEGFDVVAKILDKLPGTLSSGGMAAMEIDPLLAGALDDYRKSSDLTITTGVDSYKNLRFLWVRC